MDNGVVINFQNLLNEWEDQDVTRYYLACCLGLVDYDDGFVNFRNAKHIFWTKNQTNIMLDEILETMLEKKIIEFDEEHSKYRWNSVINFDK